MTSPVPSRSLKLSLEEATSEYQNQLFESPGASLLLERGIDHKTIEHFRLGYVSNPLSGDEDYKGYLSIPYITVSGVVALRFKRVGNYGPKVLSRSLAVSRPYNVGALKKSVPIFLAEGEPDTWAAFQCGLYVVGIPGVETWNEDTGPVWARMFRFCSRVEGGPGLYILQQGDTKILREDKTAAQMMSDRIRANISAEVIEFPDGYDVDSMRQEFGEQYVREWVGLDGGRAG